LKSINHLLLTVVFTVLFCCSGASQKSLGKYTDYDHGYYFFWYEKWDSAFLMFNRYVNTPDDILKKGTAYKYMGEIQLKIGDLYGAQESLIDAINALDPLDEKHREVLGIAYNVLGNVSLNLQLYDEAINFYNRAINIVKGSNYELEVLNGKATALQKKGNYTGAIALYDSILTLKPGDRELAARMIDNRARTKWLQYHGYVALPEFQSALKIRTDSQYNQGLNASYAHLSDYYAKSKPDSALWYAQKMVEKAKENQSPDDMLEAIDKLIRLNSASIVKQHWYEEYKILNDSLQLSRDTTRNRFALIRYDVQKSKADNLVLQQHISRQRLLIYGLIAAAIIIIVALSSWYRKRRKRIKQESENAIRNARLKTSQKIHDVVANGLYGIMNELEHSKTIEREPLIDKIEGLYEKSRNISYEDVAAVDSMDYDKQIPLLIGSFANKQTKVITVGDQQIFWSKITGVQKRELYLVINEIMINMQKHSHAKNAVIHFHEEHNKGFIHYKDDGVGFTQGFKFRNGLNNTVSRIKSLNGEVNFEKAESGGISIAISFPLKSN
jgi:tetratricopeptide (TPR) repeat protein